MVGRRLIGKTVNTLQQAPTADSINLPPHRDQPLGVLHVELLGGFRDCRIGVRHCANGILGVYGPADLGGAAYTGVTDLNENKAVAGNLLLQLPGMISYRQRAWPGGGR